MSASPYRILRHVESGEIVLRRAKLCISFFCHLKGLMFISHLPEDEGLLFVTGAESKVNSTIHMFFMRFRIAVVWMNKDGRVVDKQLAKPWRPAYAPAAPAQYYVEANVSLLDRVNVGDYLSFDEVSA
ncbi:MAG: DUF192 domain-containing protein [bacterium]|nr:DUF192 domain-containing protein [bacterium]